MPKSVNKQQLQQWLMALTTLAAPLAKLTPTQYDDKVLQALLSLATNDGALNYISELVELFITNPNPTPEEIDAAVKGVSA